MFPNIGPTGNLIFLIFTIDDFHHPFCEKTLVIFFNEKIPVITPENFDDIPTGTTKNSFKFLDDFTISADRSIESLQVAIDDKGEVVKLFSNGQANCSKRFRFIAFAISEERPNSVLRGIFDAPISQILIETRLVNCHDRRKPHGNRGILPEVRHEPRMRIGGEPGCVS